MKRIVVITIAVWLAAFASTAEARRSAPTWQLSIEQACPSHFQGIAYYRGKVWRLERRMGLRITRATYAEHRVKSCDAVEPFVGWWRNVADRRWKELKAYKKRLSTFTVLPPHNAGWECIHSREGSWDDHGYPYYGGLQMSGGWGSAHNRARLHLSGTADNWTALQQKWLAELEGRERGFNVSWMSGQWPNTYPPCSRYF